MKKVLVYDTAKYPFKEVIQTILGVDDLTSLGNGYDLLSREKDQKTHWHDLFYGHNSEFLKLYKEFITNEIIPLFDEEITYQRVPTFRVHLVNNLGVGEFHRDRDYGHSVNEVNFHLPFTDTNEQNSIWVESQEGQEDFTPCLMKYGEVLIFDGANLKHGNKVNDSDKSRVSVDFRIIPISKYIPSDKASVNTNNKFIIGDYFV